MNTQQLNDFVKFCFPLLVKAGDYALRIQSNVGSQEEKGGENPFVHALTDADLSVQAFFEVALLAQYPEITFFGEEINTSLNMKYFPEDAEYKIFLDPIDGTRFYKDNLKSFNIIISLSNRDEFIVGMVYMPSFDICYYAMKGQGGSIATRKQMELAELGDSFSFASSSNKILSYNSSETIKKLQSDFEALDILDIYDPEKDCLTFSDVFNGNLCAYIAMETGIIDLGVIAFIAKEAGASVSDLKGEPLESPRNFSDMRYPEVLISADQDTHTKILKLLSI